MHIIIWKSERNIVHGIIDVGRNHWGKTDREYSRCKLGRRRPLLQPTSWAFCGVLIAYSGIFSMLRTLKLSTLPLLIRYLMFYSIHFKLLRVLYVLRKVYELIRRTPHYKWNIITNTKSKITAVICNVRQTPTHQVACRTYECICIFTIFQQLSMFRNWKQWLWCLYAEFSGSMETVVMYN